MTLGNDNRSFRLFACLAAGWLVVQGSRFPAHAEPAPAVQKPAGTASNPPPDPYGALPVPARPSGAPDLAYAAYQRGYYVTAMQEAMKRIKADPSDGPAMTLAGELYALGLGVRRDLAEAARWYKLAADTGDRQAIFALGIAKLKGEGVPKDRAGAAEMLEKAHAQNHAGAH